MRAEVPASEYAETGARRRSPPAPRAPARAFCNERNADRCQRRANGRYSSSSSSGVPCCTPATFANSEPMGNDEHLTPAARLLLETPDEVIMIIACALDSPVDLLRLGMACRRFRVRLWSVASRTDDEGSSGGAWVSGTNLEPLSTVAEAARRWVRARPKQQQDWVPMRPGDSRLSLMYELTRLAEDPQFSHKLSTRAVISKCQIADLSDIWKLRSTAGGGAPLATYLRAAAETKKPSWSVKPAVRHKADLNAEAASGALLQQVGNASGPVASHLNLVIGDPGPGSPDHLNSSNACDALCAPVMRAGCHYIQFTVDQVPAELPVTRTTRPEAWVGVIRPGWEDRLFGHSYKGRCFYRTDTGRKVPSAEDGAIGSYWEGMQPTENGDRVGLLLNVDTGTLTVYRNDVYLGVVATGLTKQFRWAVRIHGMTTTVRVDSAQVPP